MMKLPIRVCLISQLYLESTSRRKLSLLANGLSCLTAVMPNALESRVYGTTSWIPLGDENYGVICCRPIFVGKRTNMRWLLPSFVGRLRDLQPDVIHIENELHSLIVLQTLLQRRLLTSDSRVVVSVWANQQPSGLKQLFLAPLYRLLRSQVDLLLPGSRGGRDMFSDQGWRVRGPLPLVGVDTGVFYPYSTEIRKEIRVKAGLGTNSYVIGYIGRLAEEKGIFDLTSAFERLVRHRREAQLVVVGDGQLRTKLESISTKLGNTKLVPNLPRAEIPRWLNMFDVLVLPSCTRPFWSEQFGRVLVEAMACGVTVVGSDSGAIPEVIGDTGLIFPEGDDRELSLCLERLCSDSDFRKYLAERALKRVLENYSDEAIVGRLLSFYQGLFDGACYGDEEES